MTFMEIAAVLRDVAYGRWRVEVYQPYDVPELRYLQVHFFDQDGALQTGRKWRLSQYMTKSELVQTAFKAVMTAEEHEARERFRYKGQKVFSPHFDVEELVQLASQNKFDVRAAGVAGGGDHVGDGRSGAFGEGVGSEPDAPF